MTKTFKRVLFASLLLVSVALATPFADHGSLKVSGANIQDKNSTNFQMRGMSFFWGNYFQEGRKYWNADVLSWLVRDWKVNVVRLPVGIEDATSYANSGDAQLAAVKAMIDLCYAQGIYVIVDWHTYVNPSSNATILAQAKTFFAAVSAYSATKNNVIYEIFNEPLAISWSTIKSYATTIIPVIRANDTKGIIIVGTPNWSSEPNSVGNDKLSAYSNIAYSLHFYANESAHDGYTSRGGTAISAGNAVFVSEWGASAADGGTACSSDMNTSYACIDTAQSTTWINWMANNNVSWANWTISHKSESSSVLKSALNDAVPAINYFGGWTAADLKPAGIYIRAKLRKAAGVTSPTAFDTPTSSSSAAASSSSTLKVGKTMVHALPGRIEAENFQQASDTSITIALANGDVAGDSNLIYIDPGDWIDYKVNCAGTAVYTANFRVAVPPAGAGSTITVQVDGVTAFTQTLVSTTAANVWATQTNSLTLTAGAHTIRLVIGQGTATKLYSIFNLNWIEFLANIVPTIPVQSPDLGITLQKSPRDLQFQVPARLGSAALTVRDIHGNVRASQELIGGTNHVDCSHWPSGIYMISMRSKDGIVQRIPFALTR